MQRYRRGKNLRKKTLQNLEDSPYETVQNRVRNSTGGRTKRTKLYETVYETRGWGVLGAREGLGNIIVFPDFTNFTEVFEIW